MTVNDFLRSVIVALEEQTEQADETPKKEEQTEETPKKEETSERKKLSNAEFLTATLRFGIGEDDAELLDKLIRNATPSNMEELQSSINNFFSSDEQDKDKNNDDNTAEEKELIEVKNQLEMTRADVVELKRIIANLRDSNSSLANVNQELRIENHNLRIENEAMAKQCDSLSQELKRVKGDCDALRDAAQIIVKYLAQRSRCKMHDKI